MYHTLPQRPCWTMDHTLQRETFDAFANGQINKIS